VRKVLTIVTRIFSTICLFFIALPLVPFDRNGTTLNKLGKLWALLQLRVAGIEVTINGGEYISQPPYIIMCNHQSELDIFVLLASLNIPIKWMAKKELFTLPFLGWLLRIGKNISVDRTNPRKALQAIREAADRIQEGMNVVVFPEGTWSSDGNLLPFKMGAFILALRTRIPILPIAIKGTRLLQPEGAFVPVKKGLVQIRIGEPIDIKKEEFVDRHTLARKVRSRIENLIAMN